MEDVILKTFNHLKGMYHQVNFPVKNEETEEMIKRANFAIQLLFETIGRLPINIAEIDGIETNFSGENPTLIVHNLDQPGHVSEVTSMLAHKGVNIATMQLYRSSKGGKAVMVVECDQEVPQEGIRWLERVEGVLKVTYLGKSEEK